MARADACVGRAPGAALLMLALLRAWSTAHAQSVDGIELTWDAPAECPDRTAVLRRVRELAVDWPPAGSQLAATAKIERSRAGRFVLTLVVRAGDAIGEREIPGKTCNDVAQAAAVHLALLLNAKPAAPGEASDAAPGPDDGAGLASQTPTPDAAPQPDFAQPPSSDAAQFRGDGRPRRTHRWLIQAPMGLLQLAILPEPCFGIAAGFGVALERLRLEAQPRLWLPQDIVSATDSSVRASVKRASFDLRACFTFAWSAVELDPCVGVTVEHVWARGSGSFVASRTARATWISAGAGAQARLHVLRGMNLLAGVDAQLEADRPTIEVSGFGRLGQLGPVAVTLTLGSEWIL